jgi:hypothetical protein
VTNFKVIKAFNRNGNKIKKGEIIDVIPCSVDKLTARGFIEVNDSNDDVLLEEIIEIIENDDDAQPIE